MPTVQHRVDLTDGIHCSTLLSETIGKSVTCRLGYRFKSHEIKSLHSAVFHGRYSQRSEFAVLFLDVYSAEGLRSVASAFEFTDCFEFSLGRVPKLFVHSRRVLPFVGVTLLRPMPWRKRVSKHPLQGFHLVMSAFFLSLYNTRL